MASFEPNSKLSRWVKGGDTHFDGKVLRTATENYKSKGAKGEFQV